MKIDITDNLKVIETVWKQLSNKRSMYDDWDFRYCLYENEQFRVKCFVAHEGDQPVAMLPLQYNTDERYWELFGGGYAEENEIYRKSEYDDVALELVKQLDEPTELYFMREDEYMKEHYKGWYFEADKYFLDLRGARSYDEILEKNLSGKSRQTMRRQLRKIEKDFNIHVEPAGLDDLNILMTLNIQNFGEGSDYNDERVVTLLKDLYSLPFGAYALKVIIDGITVGVSYALFKNGTFTYWNAGVNKDAAPNVGKYLIAKNIDRAIELGADFFDAGPEDLGWKERMGLKKKPLFAITITG